MKHQVVQDGIASVTIKKRKPRKYYFVNGYQCSKKQYYECRDAFIDCLTRMKTTEHSEMLWFDDHKR